jgi:hypothetical protein
MSTSKFDSHAILALQATVIAMIKELRASDPAAVAKLQASAEREAVSMTSDFEGQRAAVLSSIRRMTSSIGIPPLRVAGRRAVKLAARLVFLELGERLAG